VGRGDAMAQLRVGLERAGLGQGALVLIVGELGIGKTRTVEDLESTALDAGFEVLIGRCYEGDGAPAYWPWVQILREAADATSSDEEFRELAGSGASDLVGLLPELEARLGVAADGGGPDGEQARFRLFDAATRFLIARSKRRKLVVVVDDLHWADASSLELRKQIATSPA